jgi:hypothetical protein
MRGLRIHDKGKKYTYLINVNALHQILFTVVDLGEVKHANLHTQLTLCTIQKSTFYCIMRG